MSTSTLSPLQALQRQQGATFAADGIPLHYGDQAAEYGAALHHTALMDRSHEGRLLLGGRDRLAIPHRLSTNDLLSLAPNEGAPTLFTSPIGRVIDRVTVYHHGDDALILTEPGRGENVRTYLQKNVFFNDDMRITDLSASTHQFVLLGVQADSIIARFADEELPLILHTRRLTIADTDVIASRTKPVVGAQWSLIVQHDKAAAVWEALTHAGVMPAGSLIYNALRIRAGRPGVGRELSGEYIPLEIGLWNEVSFSKGCYTGQEIIARMESRRKLARTIVALELDNGAEAPTPLLYEGRPVGTLTSAVTAPDGVHYGVAVIRVAAATPGARLMLPNGIPATVTRLAGVQPAELQQENSNE